MKRGKQKTNTNPDHTKYKIFFLGIIAVVAVSILVVLFTNVQRSSSEQAWYGAAITASSGLKQCDDTLGKYEIAAKDTIFQPSTVKTSTRKSTSSPWPAWTIAGTDTCAEKTLKEWSCSTGANAVSTDVACANGCEYGYCKTPTCTDSDGGINYSIVGTTTGLMLGSNTLGVPPAIQSATVYKDTCTSSTTLKEYVCSSLAGTKSRIVTPLSYNCGNLRAGSTCVAGKCVVPETCDNIDNNANRAIDEGCDDDDDNYCDSVMAITGKPTTCTDGGNDCNDASAASSPAAAEICDNLDNNCDGIVDEGCDDDDDNYCDSVMAITGTPTTCTDGGNDCNDISSRIRPGAAEACGNSIDEDCNGADPSCDTLGEQRVAVFLVDYINDGQEQSKTQIEEGMFSSTWSINNFIQDSSYGKTWLTGDVFGWVYVTEEDTVCWPNEATLLNLFSGFDINFQNYDRFMIIIRGEKTGCSYGGSWLGKQMLQTPDGLVYASKSIIRFGTFYFPSDASSTTSNVVAHELVHAFYIAGHANHYDCTELTISQDKSQCVQFDRDDVFDIMGERYWSSQPNACYKEEFQWIDDGEITTVQTSGEYLLYPFEDISSEIKSLKIPLQHPIPIATVGMPLIFRNTYGTDEIYMTYYYLEYRIPQGVDNRLTNLEAYTAPPGPNINIQGIMVRGAYIHDNKCATTYLLDMHPNSIPTDIPPIRDFYDSFLNLGESFSDPSNGITITPLEILPDGAMLININIEPVEP